tara:strand:- start:1214 stop:2044 length:831 start_codon:yes stop_codon:yes gene_type:complete
MKRATLNFFTLCCALFASSCLVQFYAESDIEGLPCNSEGQCESGYFCKDDVCVLSETLQANDACETTEECSEGLTCIDYYEGCASDINCDLSVTVGTGKRCRQACEPYMGKDAEQCPVGSRCFEADASLGLSIKGFCQEGVCSEHTDCDTNSPLNNYCVSLVNGVGSGLCVKGCDPFQCSYATACNDCPSHSQGCEPLDVSINAFYCIAPGMGAAGEPCDVFSNACTIGAFCYTEAGNTSGVCKRYCSLTQGANPACPTGERCYDLTNNVGYCGPQ